MRGWKAALGAAVAGALVGVGAVFSPVTHAEEPKLTPVQRFAACVNGGGQGNVLMLMDMSGSLRDTDPKAGRVKAASVTVNRLAASLAETRGIKVDIAVAGFSTGYQRTLDWTPLTPESTGKINADIESYAAKNKGVDTDYWSAMDGVRKEFSARTKGQANSCNMLLWFSDGEFSLNVRKSDNDVQRWGGVKPWAPDNRLRSTSAVQGALASGQHDLCRPSGLADQLRSLGIITVGLGLAVDAPPASFNLMKGISTGQGTSCGRQTTPTPGEFLMATDVDDLIFTFITALEEGKGGQNPVCVASACPEGTRTFVLDGSIGAVNATAKAPLDGTRIYLKTRTGESLELTQGKGEKNLGGSTLTWEWVTPRVLTFDLTRKSPDNWAGPWGIVFVANQKSDELAKSSITLKGDISPILANRADLAPRVGEAPIEIKLGTVDRNGGRIDPATLSDETTMNVKLLSRGQTKVLASNLKKADIEKPLRLNLYDLKPGVAELVLTLDVTTQSWQEGGKTVPGTKLEPRHASIPLNILPPVNFPSIPDKISFGSTEKPDPVTVQVPLVGEGCAWLAGPTKFTGYPEGLDAAKLSSTASGKDSCASGKLELTLDPGGLGNGSFTGTTTVMLAAKDSTAEPVAVDLAFDLSQTRPVSQPVLWTTLIGVILLGVAIPVGILYLVKFLTSKIPGNAVLAGSVSGPVDDHQAFTDNGVPMGVTNLTLAHLTNNRREVTVAGKTLKAKVGLALTEPGHVEVDTPGPSAGGRTSLQSVQGHAKLPLAVQGNWMVALDPQRPVSGPVEVTVFTAPGSPGFKELLEDVRANIRTAVAKLREGLPPDQAGPSTDPWGGGAGSAPAADPWATPQAPANDPWGTPPTVTQQRPNQPMPPQNPPANDPWGNPEGGRPSSGPSSW